MRGDRTDAGVEGSAEESRMAEVFRTQDERLCRVWAHELERLAGEGVSDRRNEQLR
jgi:hypothetical protein